MIKKIEQIGVLVYIVSNSKNEVVAVYTNNNEVEVKQAVSDKDWEIIRKLDVQPLYEKSVIGIDCDPWTGCGRQEDYYKEICKELDFEPQPKTSAFFGAWEFPVIYRTREDKQKVEKYLSNLYASGRCRGAIW